MIPIRDTVRPERRPFVTQTLIAINVAVFLYQMSLGPGVELFLATWGLIPRRVTLGGPSALATLLTSMFLHGGFLHVLGNLLYLHIFGDNVEDRVGHLRFLALYLVCGAAAGLAQVAIDSDSTIPIIGASGAIAGVTGAYLLFFPHARVLTAVPIFLFVQMMEIPAVVFLVIWFVWQLVSGFGSLGAEGGGGVAFWAHIGGFVAGMVLGPILAGSARRAVRSAWQEP